MANKNEFGEIQRKNLEAAMRLAQLSIDNSQKIMALQSQLARELLTENLIQAKDAGGAANPIDLMNQRAKLVQETMQKTLSVAQEIADIGNKTRIEFSRLLTEQLAAGSHDLVDAFQGFFKALPDQNANVVEAMQQAIANANAAFDQIAQMSTRVFDSQAPASDKKHR